MGPWIGPTTVEILPGTPRLGLSEVLLAQTCMLTTHPLYHDERAPLESVDNWFKLLCNTLHASSQRDCTNSISRPYYPTC
jgi:hypothetical protein